MNASSVSCEPLSTATRHARLHSSNCSAEPTPIRDKNCLSDKKAMLPKLLLNHYFSYTTKAKKSCVMGQRISRCANIPHVKFHASKFLQSIALRARHARLLPSQELFLPLADEEHRLPGSRRSGAQFR